MPFFWVTVDHTQAWPQHISFFFSPFGKPFKLRYTRIPLVIVSYYLHIGMTTHWNASGIFEHSHPNQVLYSHKLTYHNATAIQPSSHCKPHRSTALFGIPSGVAVSRCVVASQSRVNSWFHPRRLDLQIFFGESPMDFDHHQ